MKARGLKAACLAVGLATAWGGQANAGPSQPTEEIQLTITPSNNLSHVYFLYGTNISVGEIVSADVMSLPNLVAGQSTTDIFSIASGSLDAYTVIGLYDDTNKLVTLGLNSNEASNVIGYRDFQDEFGFTEDSVASALQSNDANTILEFFQFGKREVFWQILNGTEGQLVNFSNGNDGGSLLAQIVVPEPSAFLLASIGTIALVAAYRKQKPIYRPGRKNIRDP